MKTSKNTDQKKLWIIILNFLATSIVAFPILFCEPDQQTTLLIPIILYVGFQLLLLILQKRSAYVYSAIANLVFSGYFFLLLLFNMPWNILLIPLSIGIVVPLAWAPQKKDKGLMFFCAFFCIALIWIMASAIGCILQKSNAKEDAIPTQVMVVMATDHERIIYPRGDQFPAKCYKVGSTCLKECGGIEDLQYNDTISVKIDEYGYIVWLQK